MLDIFHQPRGHRFAVLGFGRSGRAAAEWLLSQGAEVTVFSPEKAPDTGRLSALGCRFCTGEMPASIEADALVRSPGIRPDHPTILRSLARGALLTSEIELFLHRAPCFVIGVTGSDGKTTTSALIAALLRAAGYHALLGGNNGTPLLPAVGELGAHSFAVLELSSFQLMTVRKSPDVAVLTNITPNHLDWHTDMNEYKNAKRHIFLHGSHRLVLNAAFAHDTLLTDGFSGELALFSAESDEKLNPSSGLELFYPCNGEAVCLSATGKQVIAPLAEFALIGRHNLENLLAALAAVKGFVPYSAAENAIKGFHGVRHRLQTVATVSGVRFVNSSIDTSPTRTAAALSALGGELLVIAGGKGKGLPMQGLGDLLAARASGAFLYGDMAGEIAHAISGRVPTRVHKRFADAFFDAAKSAKSGQTVLLSPGCTAFDQFRDFEERGDTFCALVERWASKMPQNEQNRQ